MAKKPKRPSGDMATTPIGHMVNGKPAKTRGPITGSKKNG